MNRVSCLCGAFLLICVAALAQEASAELAPELASKLQIAAQHVKAKQPQEAIALYTEVLAARGDLFSPYAERGKIYHDLKEYAKAAADYAEALKRKPDLWELYLRRCTANYAAGAYAQAVADCDSYSASNPRTLTHDPFYYKAMSLGNLKQYEGAVAAFAQTFQINNDLPDAHLYLANLHLQADNLLGALREFTVVIQQRPGDKAAFKQRAAIKAALGDDLGSKDDLAKAQ